MTGGSRAPGAAIVTIDTTVTGGVGGSNGIVTVETDAIGTTTVIGTGIGMATTTGIGIEIIIAMATATGTAAADRATDSSGRVSAHCSVPRQRVGQPFLFQPPC